MAVPIYKKFYDFKKNLENDNNSNNDYLLNAFEFYSELNELHSRFNDGITYNQYKELAENPTDAENYFLSRSLVEFGKGFLDLDLVPKDVENAIINNIAINDRIKIKEDVEITRILSYIVNVIPIKPELTANQQQKIGLLIRSGIIDFLQEKTPSLSYNQISGFIELLTKEPLKRASINPHLSKDNRNYPIKNAQDENDLDLILKKYGINPQQLK